MFYAGIRQRLLRLDNGKSLWYNAPRIAHSYLRRSTLANHKSALKRIRSSEKKRQRNRIIRSRSRSGVKKARVAIDGGDMEQAREATREAIRELDKAASRGVIHKNNAARRKSRLMKRLAELEAQAQR